MAYQAPNTTDSMSYQQNYQPSYQMEPMAVAQEPPPGGERRYSNSPTADVASVSSVTSDAPQTELK